MTDIEHLRDRIATFCAASGTPGFLAGLAHDGRRSLVAHGVANVATGAPMREDTGFLLGSITKVMTTSLVMAEVERGTLDLDAPVTAYLPEFRWGGIRVRHLLSHTSGIDADLFFPEASGPDALRVYVERLGNECGVLFEPGEYVSYSNGGMIVAGRLLEVVTGIPYATLLGRNVVPAGATGHFADPVTGERRPSTLAALPETWGPAGGTATGTIDDLLAFGREHLGGGPLSAESVRLMATTAHDMGTPGISPVGLGWLVRRLGGTTVLTMTGASPGGIAVLAVLPEHDLVFAAYGNDAGALTLHDELVEWLAGQFGEVARQVHRPRAIDLAPYAGTYRSNQLRIDVRVVDGELEVTVTYEPADADQERVFTGFIGGPFAAPPMRYVPVGEGLFAPAEVPLADLPPYYLVSYHGGGACRSAGGRMARRAAV